MKIKGTNKNIYTINQSLENIDQQKLNWLMYVSLTKQTWESDHCLFKQKTDTVTLDKSFQN